MKASSVNLSEAALTYLASLPTEDRQVRQQDINRFVLWYGRERAIDSLTVTEIARYGEQVQQSDADFKQRLAPVRDFLTFARKKGIIEIGLASHLGSAKAATRTRKTVATRPAAARKEVLFTADALAQMQADLAKLKAERPHAADEIRKAAADKDFRENAPLEAAREHHEQLESRIKELETLLEKCVVQDEQAPEDKTGVARLSCTVTLRDMSSGEKATYMLVSPNEIAPAKGKISILSPVGKAVAGHRQGETVEVTAPSGKLVFRIDQVQRSV